MTLAGDVVVTVEPGVCSLHSEARDHNLTVEAHHLLPVAWQAVWTPPGATVKTTSRGPVWAPETVQLSPTCHRNSHALLVRLMKWMATPPGQAADDDAQRIDAARAALPGPLRRWREMHVALEAPTRWVNAGGVLSVLLAAHEWGVA